MADFSQRLQAEGGDIPSAYLKTYVSNVQNAGSRAQAQLLASIGAIQGSPLGPTSSKGPSYTDQQIAQGFAALDASPELAQKLYNQLGIGTPELRQQWLTNQITPASQTYKETGGTITQLTATPNLTPTQDIAKGGVSTDFEKGGTTTATNQQSPQGSDGYFRIGNDVYDSSGNYISFEEAQNRGIVDQLASIPQASADQSRLAGKTSTEGYYRVGQDVYDANGNYVSFEEAKKRGIVDQLESIPQKGDGQTAESTKPGGNPVSDFVSTYQSILDSLGIADFKSQLNDINDKFGDLQNEKAEKARDINNDPWLTEGVRVQRLRRLDEEYEDRELILTNQIKLYDSLYQQGIAQAEFLATGTQREQQFLAQFALQQQEAIADLLKFDDSRFKTVNGGLFDLETMSFIVPPSEGGGSGISNQQIDNERSLLGQFNSEPIVKDYNSILAKSLSVKKIIQAGVGGPGDLALVYEFMKGLDPGSVVRESEYATAAKSGNIFLGALAKFNGYFKETGGFMPPQVQNAFADIVDAKLAVQTQLYTNLATNYQQIALRQGLNPDNVVLNYQGANKQSADPVAELQDDIRKYQDTMSREQIIQLAKDFYPELTLDEIGRYVYTMIPDK